MLCMDGLNRFGFATWSVLAAAGLALLLAFLARLFASTRVLSMLWRIGVLNSRTVAIRNRLRRSVTVAIITMAVGAMARTD